MKMLLHSRRCWKQFSNFVEITPNPSFIIRFSTCFTFVQSGKPCARIIISECGEIQQKQVCITPIICLPTWVCRSIIRLTLAEMCFLDCAFTTKKKRNYWRDLICCSTITRRRAEKEYARNSAEKTSADHSGREQRGKWIPISDHPLLSVISSIVTVLLHGVKVHDISRAMTMIRSATYRATQAGGGPLAATDATVKMAKNLLSDLQDVQDEEERERRNHIHPKNIENDTKGSQQSNTNNKKRKLDFTMLKQVCYIFFGLNE